MFAIAESSAALGTEAAERVTAHQRRPFVQSAGVCPSSLQLTETLMMVKAPPALLCRVYCNSYSELCRSCRNTVPTFCRSCSQGNIQVCDVARVDRFYSESRLSTRWLLLLFRLLSFLFTLVFFIRGLWPFFVCERQRGENNCVK